MSLSGYARACSGLAEELKGSLSKADVEELRRELKAVTMRDWMLWRMKHEKEIERFVSSPPSKRERREWRDPPLRRRLVLAAIQHVLEGQALLRKIEDAFLLPGISWRDMAASAGSLFGAICDVHIPFWNLGGESPFPEDRLLAGSGDE